MRSRPNKKPQYEVLLRRQRLPAEPPLLGLDEVRRVGEQRVAAAVVEMEVRVDHDVHVVDRPAHVLAQRPVEALLRRLGTGADVVVDPGAVMNAGIDQDLLRAAADGGAPERRIDGLPIPAAQNHGRALDRHPAGRDGRHGIAGDVHAASSLNPAAADYGRWNAGMKDNTGLTPPADSLPAR